MPKSFIRTLFLKSRLIFLFVGASSLFIFLGVPMANAAFGVSPPFVNAVHLVPGAVYSQTIYLVQDHPDQDLPINGVLTIPDEIRPWISIDKGLDFIIPKGTRQFPVVMTIRVPQNQPLGQFSGNLIMASKPAANGQVTIAIGANVAINLIIGKGIYESYQAYISFLDIESGWGPRVEIKFRNDGNIPESFDAAVFELYDQFDTVRLAYIQKNSNFPETPPFTTKEYTLDFPTDFHIGVGEYWGIANFYKNGELVATQKTVFHVVPPGALSVNSSAAFFQNITNNWSYTVGGAVVILALVAFTYRKRLWFRKKSKYLHG